MTKVGWYALSNSTTLESNKSHNGRVLSQSSIFGQNPKFVRQEFNDLQTHKLSKK